MAKLLQGYRGQSDPEDPIKSITDTYVENKPAFEHESRCPGGSCYPMAPGGDPTVISDPGVNFDDDPSNDYEITQEQFDKSETGKEWAAYLKKGEEKPGDPAEFTAKEIKKMKKAEIKAEKLTIKAEEKGKSDRWKVRKGVEKDPAANDPLFRSRYNLRGEGTGMLKKKFGGLRSEETGKIHIPTPHFSIEKTPVQPTKQPAGRGNPFRSLPTFGPHGKIKHRLKGMGPKHEYWKEGFQADWSGGGGKPHLETKGIHGDLPVGKEKFERKLKVKWY